MIVEINSDEARELLTQAIEQRFRGYKMVGELEGLHVFSTVRIELEIKKPDPDAFQEEL